jgi:hypothetical protein
MESLNCPHCGQTHAPGVRFCPVTGRPMPEALTCPKCGQKVQADWALCGFCGHPLGKKPRGRWDRSNRMWFTAALGVIVLIAVSIYLIFPVPPSPKPEPTASTTPVIQPSLSPTSLLELTPTSDISPSPKPPIKTQTPSTSTPTPIITPTIKDYKQVFLGNLLLFDLDRDAPGCFDVTGVNYSPTYAHFLIVPNCLEGDNLAFLYRADGSDKREITGEQDYMLYGRYDWSPDGRWIVYQRANSFGYSPAGAPPEGLVRYDTRTGEKILLLGKSGPPNWGYPASPAWSPDGRWIAFLYVESQAPIAVSLLNTEDHSVWYFDKFPYEGDYGSLRWGTNQTGENMLLHYLEPGGTISRTYSISVIPGTPPGTPKPVEPSPSQSPRLQLTVNSFCRGGPGSSYNKIWTFYSGDILDIVGRDGDWWLVLFSDPGTRHDKCWIHSDNGVAVGDIASVPYSNYRTEK